VDQVPGGHKVGIENEDELPPRLLQPQGKGACLIAVSFRPPHVADVDSSFPPVCHPGPADFDGSVVRVIEELYLEKLSGIVQGRSRVHEAFHDLNLVVDGKLYGDPGKWTGPGAVLLASTPGEEEEADPVEREGYQETKSSTGRQQDEPSDPVWHAVPFSSPGASMVTLSLH